MRNRYPSTILFMFLILGLSTLAAAYADGTARYLKQVSAQRYPGGKRGREQEL